MVVVVGGIRMRTGLRVAVAVVRSHYSCSSKPRQAV